MHGRRRHRLRAAALAVLAVAGLLTAATGTARGEQLDERRSYTGTIEGADFRAEVPADWNGTLVLYSHGYYVEAWPPPPGVALALWPETEEWLLDHGYAVAASDYQGRYGYAVREALHDQVALLDWFDEHVGRPSRTVTSGMSMGGQISVLLAERNPHRFDGVLAQCADLDGYGMWNLALDAAFAARELLLPGRDVDLVGITDPAKAAADVAALQAAVTAALETPQGRAKLALIGAIGGSPDWSTALEPRPTTLVERIRQQTTWVNLTYIGGLGPLGRIDLERRAGGNPSWNVGIDYGRQLARSEHRGLVRQAYRAAGLDVRDDLDRLAAAPRIAPEPRALAWMYRYGVVRGRTPAPVLTLHNPGDGGAVAEQQRWYARQVDRFGDRRELRQLYSDRGGHCAISAAEEIVSLRTLLDRVETGRWPDLRPATLNAAAGAFDERYQQVLDILTGQQAARPPAFARHTPARFLRPSF